MSEKDDIAFRIELAESQRRIAWEKSCVSACASAGIKNPAAIPDLIIEVQNALCAGDIHEDSYKAIHAALAALNAAP